MKIEDFEQAIEALTCDVTIDEFKLKGGEVRMCIARTEKAYVEWDEYGRAFGCPLADEDERPYRVERMQDFDLKFD